MKKTLPFFLVTLVMAAWSMQALGQAEISQPNGVPYLTPNSVLYGSDIIIDDQPAQDQRNVSISVAFNGWLYACYSVNESGSWSWRIFKSEDDGASWSLLRNQALSTNWYVSNVEIVVTGTTVPDLKVFVGRILNNDVSANSEMIISQLDGNSGNTLVTLRDNIVSGTDIFRDISLASDYRFPAFSASPFSVGILYSKSIAARDSIVCLTSSDGGMSITAENVVTTTVGYTRNVSLAYGRCWNYFNGRYFAAWEERSSAMNDLGQIFTAHSTTYFYDPFTSPVRLDNLIGSTADYARNPSIACQFNDTDNDLLNLTEVVLFDRAFNGTLTDFDIVGCYNKEAASTDNWYIFGLNATYLTSDFQPDIHFDPGYNNFLATYYNSTDQKLPYVVKYMDFADPYNWILISDHYNDGVNLMNPYPKVEINPVYNQVAHVWNTEGAGGGVAVFDAEYSHLGVADRTPQTVSVSVSPNPASNTATFRVDLKVPGSLVADLYTLQGTKVLRLASGEFSSGVQHFTADVSSLPAGCYLFRVAVGAGASTGRLIIQR